MPARKLTSIFVLLALAGLDEEHFRFFSERRTAARFHFGQDVVNGHGIAVRSENDPFLSVTVTQCSRRNWRKCQAINQLDVTSILTWECSRQTDQNGSATDWLFFSPRWGSEWMSNRDRSWRETGAFQTLPEAVLNIKHKSISQMSQITWNQLAKRKVREWRVSPRSRKR